MRRWVRPVRAVFPGRVAFADQYDPFGQIVILDHGDHFYTLMGDLGSIDVKVGRRSFRGSQIGTVGQGPKGPLLYFEVRKSSTAGRSRALAGALAYPP